VTNSDTISRRIEISSDAEDSGRLRASETSLDRFGLDGRVRETGGTTRREVE
jgi:hypothetical protein